MPPGKSVSALIAVIEAGNVASLQLSLVEALDTQILDALCAAARKGVVEAIPLLWERLGPNGKKKFVDSDDNKCNQGYLPPLHEAVQHGHVEMVQLLLGTYKFNINQIDRNGKTPLFYATKNGLEMTRFLLENGADVNRGGGSYGHLWAALHQNKFDIAQLLLEYKADPNLNRKPVREEAAAEEWSCYRCSDLAIMYAKPKILSMLFENGAIVGYDGREENLALNEMLTESDISRETKVIISKMLVEHATKDRDTLLFLQASFEKAIATKLKIMDEDEDEEDDDDAVHDEFGIHILLEAGVVPTSRAFYIAIRRGGDVSLCQMLVRHGGNPFLLVQDDTPRIEAAAADPAASPFLAAARRQDILIFDYFLDLWNNEHSEVHGRNANGDYPLHVLCRDRHVSRQVMLLAVARQIDAVSTLSGQEGLFPFQLASVGNADVDTIFYLLNRCPDALRRFRLRTVADPVSTVIRKRSRIKSSNKSEKRIKSEGSGTGTVCLEDYNALRDEIESLRAEKDTTLQSLRAEIESLQQSLTVASASASAAAAATTTQEGTN